MVRLTSSSATKSPKRLPMPAISILIGWSSPGSCAKQMVLSAGSLVVFLRPQERDEDDAENRHRGEHERHGVRRALIEVLVLLLHHLRGRLGLTDHVAGHDLHGSELTQRPGKAQHDAVHDGPLD